MKDQLLKLSLNKSGTRLTMQTMELLPWLFIVFSMVRVLMSSEGLQHVNISTRLRIHQMLLIRALFYEVVQTLYIEF